MVIAKFGGTSVGTPEAVARACAIVADQRQQTVVVVSALGGITDDLLAAARHAARQDRRAASGVTDDLRRRHDAVVDRLAAPDDRETARAELEAIWARLDALLRRAEAERDCPSARTDAILASGELASSRLIGHALRGAGVAAAWVDARHVLVTDASFGRAVPDLPATRRNAVRIFGPLLAAGRVPVVGGFVGATPAGETTTIGRGGSDWSAAIFGACLEASEIQIWTDVDGVYSADPRTDSRARRFARLTFHEAERLARAGAKVLHPETIAPARAAGIPVRVLSSFDPAAPGTVISEPGAFPAIPALAWPLVHGVGGREVTA